MSQSHSVEYVRKTINLSAVTVDALENITSNMQPFNEFVGDVMRVTSDGEMQCLRGFKEKHSEYVKEVTKHGGHYIVSCIADVVKTSIKQRKPECNVVVINLSSLHPSVACAIHALIDSYIDSGECDLAEYKESTHVTAEASEIKNGVWVIVPGHDEHKGKMSGIKLHEFLEDDVYEIAVIESRYGSIKPDMHPTIDCLNRVITNLESNGYFCVFDAVFACNSIEYVLPTLTEYVGPYIKRLRSALYR